MSAYELAHLTLMHGLKYLSVIGLCFIASALLLLAAGYLSGRWYRRNAREVHFDPVSKNFPKR
jgi:hypothetical protein